MNDLNKRINYWLLARFPRPLVVMFIVALRILVGFGIGLIWIIPNLYISLRLLVVDEQLLGQTIWDVYFMAVIVTFCLLFWEIVIPWLIYDSSKDVFKSMYQSTNKLIPQRKDYK